MKRLDPRSVLIGFLVAVIAFMSIGATNSTFDSITVNEILIGDKILEFKYARGSMAGDTLATISLGGLNMKSSIGSARYGPRGLSISNRLGKSSLSNMGLTFSDWEGKEKLDIGALLCKVPFLYFYNEYDKQVVDISTIDDNAMISINNKDGQETIALTHTTSGHGLIDINNKDGQNTIALTHFTGGDGAITLNNKHEKNIVYISSTEEDDGAIILADRYGEDQWSVTGKR